MKGTVIAHSVVIATVVAFGAVVGMDIYRGIPTLGGDPMYLTKVVMFLVVMNLVLWIGSLFDSLAVKRNERLYESASKRVDRLLKISSEKGELLNRVAEEAAKWRFLYLMRIKVNGQTVVNKKNTSMPKENVEKFWQRKRNHAKWESFARKVGHK